MNAEVTEKSSNSIRQNPLLRKIIIFGAVILVSFLLGFIPMWLKNRESAQNLAATQRQLKIARLQNLLGSAVINAQRADYEPARQNASDFFNSLQSEVAEQQNNSSLTPAQQERVRPLFAPRDEIITLLARSDPAAVAQLSDLYVSFLKAVEGS